MEYVLIMKPTMVGNLILPDFEVDVQNPHFSAFAVDVLYVDLISSNIPLETHVILAIQGNTTVRHNLLYAAQSTANSFLKNTPWRLAVSLPTTLYAEENGMPAHFAFHLVKRD